MEQELGLDESMEPKIINIDCDSVSNVNAPIPEDDLHSVIQEVNLLDDSLVEDNVDGVVKEIDLIDVPFTEDNLGSVIEEINLIDVPLSEDNVAVVTEEIDLIDVPLINSCNNTLLDTAHIVKEPFIIDLSNTSDLSDTELVAGIGLKNDLAKPARQQEKVSAILVEPKVEDIIEETANPIQPTMIDNIGTLYVPDFYYELLQSELYTEEKHRRLMEEDY